MSETTAAKTAPCQQACPAGVDVPRYIRHLQQGRATEALAVVRERIPFPLVCGHACFHPCEAKCGRRQFDAAVAIRMLKRAAAEQGRQPPLPVPRPASGRKAAVIGAGPAGLTCAHYLALQGHAVTVFEAQERAGGMLRFGIPAFRLPDDVVDAEIDRIVRSGVEIRTGERVASAEALLGDGFDTVLVACGAWRSAKLGIDGEAAPHVLDGLDFLRRVKAGTAPPLGPRVAVVGGGNTALDAARVSRRLGADVIQLYRRGASEMPASAEEIAAALEEGVAIDYLCAPVRIEAGTLTCVRMALGPPDASGRPRPVPVPGSEFTVAASTVIVAVGQSVELPAPSLQRRAAGTAEVDGGTLAASVSGVFAAGDAVLGPASIIDAIAQGRQAAAAIDRFLGGDGDIDRVTGFDAPPALPPAAERGAARQEWRTIALHERLRGFELVEQAYDAAAARAEAGRCLSCDLRDYAVEVNPEACKDCGYCQEVCGLDVFTRADGFNASGYQPAVARHAERCIGCLNCIYICPDFAIAVTQRPQRAGA